MFNETHVPPQITQLFLQHGDCFKVFRITMKSSKVLLVFHISISTTKLRHQFTF